MFKIFTNLQLKSTLKNTVERIPQDLIIWQKEIKKLRAIKRPTKKQNAQALEYFGLYRYYQGKIFAYLFVLSELGEVKYVNEYSVWQKLNWSGDRVFKKGPWQTKKSPSDH